MDWLSSKREIEMDGLTEGRMVHFVVPSGKHRAGIVLNVIDKKAGKVDLVVFSMPDDGLGGFLMNTNTEYSEEPKPGTWHWIEKA
jgi:hypothetical protein